MWGAGGLAGGFRVFFWGPNAGEAAGAPPRPQPKHGSALTAYNSARMPYKTLLVDDADGVLSFGLQQCAIDAGEAHGVAAEALQAQHPVGVEAPAVGQLDAAEGAGVRDATGVAAGCLHGWGAVRNCARGWPRKSAAAWSNRETPFRSSKMRATCGRAWPRHLRAAEGGA